jgi:hypothetical protein
MDLAALSDEELVDQVTTWAGRVAAGEAVLLRLIGELDAREAWAVHGVRSCAQWLSWRLGLSLTTAQERVRVARALRALPATSAALAEGRLSYAKVRAITRVASAEDEQVWVDLARRCTGAQLDQAARSASRAKQSEPDPPPVKQAAQARWDDDGDLVLTLRIPAHQAHAVLAALEQHQTAEQADRDTRLAELAGGTTTLSAEGSGPIPDPAAYVDPPYPQLRELVGLFDSRTPEEEQAIADWWAEHHRLSALRDAACAERDRLQAEADAQHVPTGRATLADGLTRALLHPVDGPPVKLHLLVDPVSGWARTTRDELLPPSTLDAVLRTLPGRHRLPRVRPLRPSDLRAHDRGRRSRLVSPALRAFLGRLDGERCRFPGCSHTRFLHAHHVKFWHNGGSTDLENLLLVCSRHHQLIHDEGYELVLDPDRTLHVRTPDGTALEHHPALPHSPAEDLPAVAADTLEYNGERLDLGYVVNVLLQHAA